MFTQGLQTFGIGAAPLAISGFSWSVGSNSVTITISGSEGATWNYSDSNISGPPSSGTIGAGGTSILSGTFSRPTCSSDSIAISASISASGETIIEEGVPTTLSTSVSGTTPTTNLFVSGSGVVNGNLSSNTGTISVSVTGSSSSITRILVYMSAGGGSGVLIDGSFNKVSYINASSGSVNANLTATGSASNRFQVFVYARPVGASLTCWQGYTAYPSITYNLS
jgi:hypothetical protein